jgi:hypothetical protein
LGIVTCPFEDIVPVIMFTPHKWSRKNFLTQR